MNSAYVPRSSLIPLRTMAIVVAAARAFHVLQRWAKVRRQCYGRAIWNGHGQLQDRRMFWAYRPLPRHARVGVRG